MKISLSLLSVGMIAAAASAGSTDFTDFTGTGLHQIAGSRTEDVGLTTLFSTDFNSYTTGVVATDLGAGTAGQGGWWAYCPTNFQNFNIVTNAGGKALKSGWGSNAASGTIGYLWQDNGGAGFAHNIHADVASEKRVTEFDFDLTRFSNSVATNKGQTQLRTYDASGTYTAMGFIFDNYATGTNPSIRGLAYLGGPGVTSVGTYAFTLATGSSIGTTANGQIHNYYTAYDETTNRVEWGWQDNGGANAIGYYFDLTGYQGGEVIPAINETDFLTIRNGATAVGNMQIDNVWFGYNDTPAPGAVALLGLAGVAARRRRN